MSQTAILRVYPVPASASVFVDVYVSDAALLEVDLFNTLGQQVGSYRFEPGAGRRLLEIDLSAFAEGIYTGRLSENGARVADMKLIKRE